eukprot:TRINITY_DN27860_c0_g1_i1.p1 TRINITY_DN27860_c0_g1~~TRINITY_DN27860_c0_g1_i1.p1  ORF type:complete len:302 (+),score=38.75 TRINITY_DN27860_c0_g1_i1:53-958(+)
MQASNYLTYLQGPVPDEPEDEFFEDFQVEDEDEVVDEHAGPSPAAPVRRLIVLDEVSTECSICFETEAAALVQLGWGCEHRFCRACLRDYLTAKIGGGATVTREVSWGVRDRAGALVIKSQLLSGVVCPRFQCACIIDQTKIADIVDPIVFDKLNRYLSNAAVEAMRADLPPCPAIGCGGVLQEDCQCTNADCRLRTQVIQLRKSAKEARHTSRSQQLQARMLAAVGKSVYLLATKVGMKCCPNCWVPIEKNLGCDHMICSRCNHDFAWSKAPLFGTGSHWFRPQRGEKREATKLKRLGFI